MHLDAGGALTPSDHVMDTLETRFGGVQALSIVKADDRAFVFAGGADDGVSVSELVPGGHLIHLQSLAHDVGSGLENISDIEAVRVGNEIQIFVASSTAPDVTQYTWALADLGDVVTASSAGGRWRR